MERKKITPEDSLKQMREIHIFMKKCTALIGIAIGLDGAKPAEAVRAKMADFAWFYFFLIKKVFELANCELILAAENEREEFEGRIQKGFRIVSLVQKNFELVKNVDKKILEDLIFLIANVRENCAASKNDEFVNTLLAKLNCLMMKTKRKNCGEP
jgi:hypothetical protein